MKNYKVLIPVAIILCLILCLIAFNAQKVDLQTEEDVIKYLENYIEENDKWGKLADELGFYHTVIGSGDFKSTSYAKKDDERWTVVLHGSITGYTDHNKTKRETLTFSYVAMVTTDGNVSELFIKKGNITNIDINYQ